MYVCPLPNDTPQIAALKADIESAWQRQIAARKEVEKAHRDEGMLRAKFREITENLPIGAHVYAPLKNGNGILEASFDSPYIWVRLFSKDGKLGSKRIKFEEGMPLVEFDFAQEEIAIHARADCDVATCRICVKNYPDLVAEAKAKAKLVNERAN
jgi:hypothetical protein